MKYDLVGIGKVNLDIVTYQKTTEKFVGGHVPNIISDAQAIGLKTALIARVGKDEAGNECLNEFKHRGVDISHITVDDDPTPSVTVKLIKGDRIITALPAKLTNYTQNHRSLIKNAKAVFVDTKTINFETCMKDCISAKVMIISSLQHLGDPYSDGVKLLSTYLPDLLFANQEEAEKSSELANLVLSNGGTVVTTLGGVGCRIEHNNHKNEYKAFKAKVIDATGAGDAFAAGYLFGVLRNLDEKHSATIANAMGALAVSSKGPVLKITMKEIEQYIESQQTKA